MDAIKNGDKIFSEVAASVEWTSTTSIKEVSTFLNKLLIETKGLVIVDFLDSSNWDNITSIEVIEDKGVLFIHWRDYRNIKESKEEQEMRMLAFPASLYSSLIKFKELRIVKTKNFPVFILRGHALKDKEIKGILQPGSSEYLLLDNQDNFSKMAVRKINDQFETYLCLNTPIFSMLINPKNSGYSAFNSKQILYYYNLSDSLLRLNKVKEELEKEELTDEDIICEKANTVRRILEYVLKVELCYRYRQINVKKDYSDLLLGDLMKLIRPFRETAMNDFLTHITIWLNELSHESGKPIKKEKATATTYMTILYTQLLQSEIKLFPYPHSNDDGPSKDIEDDLTS